MLLAQRRGEALHLLFERFAIVFGGFGADIAAGGEDMAMLADVVELRGFAKAGDVLIGRSLTSDLSPKGRGGSKSLSLWERDLG